MVEAKKDVSLASLVDTYMLAHLRHTISLHNIHKNICSSSSSYCTCMGIYQIRMRIRILHIYVRGYNILASESVLHLLSSAHTHTLDSHHLGCVRVFRLCHRRNSQPVLDKLEHLLITQQCPVTCTYSHPLHCIETVCLHSTLSEFVMKERERQRAYLC